MMKIRKRTANEKMDDLYSLIIFLSLCLFYVLFIKPTGRFFFVDLVPILAISWLPSWYRRKKQYKEVAILLEMLDISIEDLREAFNIKKYDLINWETDKSNLTIMTLYDIEDYLLKEYFLRFKKEFVLKDYLKAQQSTEETEKR